VASLARPGGNITGLNTPRVSLTGKRLQLLIEAVPGLSRVAVLSDTVSSLVSADYESFARTLGVQLLPLEVRAPDELESAFEAATSEHVGGLYVQLLPLLSSNRARVVALAAEHRLPAMYGGRVFVDDGGLMTYEHRIADSHRRSAYYVDRILRGVKPADLPVEQPMRFDFILNLKTAQALGITFPNEIMLQVTEVIQ
jgi:putative tryptophan/tyrosine transport system substrate-binding protein